MRQNTICIYEHKLMYVVAGQLYDQVPNRQPRNVETIMNKLRSRFRMDDRCYNDNEFYSIRIPKSKMYDFVKDILFYIPEFMDLNLSQIEYENGVDVFDENRSKFRITSVYSKWDNESWKYDFIDLDSFVGNVVRRYFNLCVSENDCFGCIHHPKNSESTLQCGSSNECKLCVVNPNLMDNYQCRRTPRGKYTFSCKYDCPKSRQICCEECDAASDCKFKCNSKSAECGLAIYF